MRQINAKVLKFVRKDAGYSNLTKAAEAIGIAPSYLCALEKGQRPGAYLDTLDKIARAYGKKLEIRMVSRSEEGREVVDYL